MDSSVISAVDLYLGSSCECCVATYSHSLVSSLSLTWPRNCLLLCIWRSIAPGFLLLYLWSERALWTFLHSLKLPWDKIRMVCGKASHMKSYGALHCHTLPRMSSESWKYQLPFWHWPFQNIDHTEKWHQPFPMKPILRNGINQPSTKGREICSGAPPWHPDFQQRSHCQTKFAMYVKNKVSFTLYKYKPSGREINFFSW